MLICQVKLRVQSVGWGVLVFLGSLLDPFGAEALANPEGVHSQKMTL
jgi:hypothetical protein